MTDETKNLFNAPWSAYPLDDVGDANGNFVCSCETPEMAHRLARLPELYDALWESIFLVNRLIGAWEEGIDFGEFCDQYLKDYDNVPSGFTFEWAKLLEKVRDGK